MTRREDLACGCTVYHTDEDKVEGSAAYLCAAGRRLTDALCDAVEAAFTGPNFTGEIDETKWEPSEATRLADQALTRHYREEMGA